MTRESSDDADTRNNDSTDINVKKTRQKGRSSSDCLDIDIVY